MVPSDDLTLLADDHTERLTARILDAALEEFSAYGLRRTNVDGVARRAGLARVTVYRRFANKQDLMRAVVLREARRAMVLMVRAAEHRLTVQERVVEGFVTGVTLARTSPLLTRLVDSEPETVLPVLTTDSKFVLTFLRDFLADQLRRSPTPPASPAITDPDAAAEVMIRLALSFFLAPHSCIPLDNEDDLRAFAHTFLVPLLTPAPSQ